MGDNFASRAWRTLRKWPLAIQLGVGALFVFFVAPFLVAIPIAIVSVGFDLTSSGDNPANNESSTQSTSSTPGDSPEPAPSQTQERVSPSPTENPSATPGSSGRHPFFRASVHRWTPRGRILLVGLRLANQGDESAYGRCTMTVTKQGEEIGRLDWYSPRRVEPGESLRLSRAVRLSLRTGIVPRPKVADCGAVTEDRALDVHPYIHAQEISFQPLDEANLRFIVTVFNIGHKPAKWECTFAAFEFGRMVGFDIFVSKRQLNPGQFIQAPGVLRIEDEGAFRVNEVRARDCGTATS